MEESYKSWTGRQMVTWKDDVMEKESCKSYDVSEAAGDISSSAKL